MYIVFRIINNNYANKEIVALCSDLCIAEECVMRLVSDNSFYDNVLYAIGTDDDI